MGLRGLRGLLGLRELWGLRRIRGCYIFNVRWLGHHGNRLYGFMGLRSKMLDWVTGCSKLSYGALLVGWLVVVARGLYLARHLYTLFVMTMVTLMFDKKSSEIESLIDGRIKGIINIMVELHHFQNERDGILSYLSNFGEFMMGVHHMMRVLSIKWQEVY